MDQKDITALARGIGPVVNDAIRNALAPIVARILALESRPVEKGEPGRDGFDLDAFDIVPQEDGRTIEMRFEQGEVRHTYELVFPVIIDRGVYKAGEPYQTGDAVTWGGSLWIAQRATNAKPDSDESGWRLAVKKGRDGKDAK